MRQGCSVQPVRGFSLVYHMTPALMVRIGCALGAEQSISAQSAPFEHGTMLWRGDTRQIFVLRRDGSWTAFPDTWQPTDVLADAGAPPAGKFAPIGRLGKLWRQPDLRAALGWETAAEIPLVGAVEEFAHARMIWTSDRLIYVLYTDGTWQSYPDTFVDQP